MKDKFCVSKTLTYLVLLIAVVAGAFFLGSSTSQKTVTNPEAAGSKCKTDTGITGIWRTSACPDGFTEYTGQGGSYTTTSNKKYFCCLANTVGGGSTYQSPADQETAKQDCVDKADKIATKTGNRCTIYTGKSSIKNHKITCDTKLVDDFTSCSGDVGDVSGTVTGNGPVKNNQAKADDYCNEVKGKFVPGSVVNVQSSTLRTCLVYTGKARKVGNVDFVEVSYGTLDYTDEKYCIRVSKIDRTYINSNGQIVDFDNNNRNCGGSTF